MLAVRRPDNYPLGQALPQELIQRARAILWDSDLMPVPPNPNPPTGPEAAFAVVKPHAVTKEIVDTWVANEDNLRRALAAVGREGDPLPKLFSFYALRTRTLSWGPRLDAHGMGFDGTQAVVLITLRRFDFYAGSFLVGQVMEEGQDLVLKGDQPISWPGREGGLLVVIRLQLFKREPVD